VTARAVLRHEIRVPVVLPEAMRLFTPVGERGWVGERWEPVFPAGERGDGDEVGTVFLTEHAGLTTFWAVVERREDRVRYARVTPGRLAGLVEVRCRPHPAGGTAAEVTYDLTALGESGRAELAEFASGYEADIGGWERLIAEAVAAGRAP
jgi:hypothetical protein